MSSEATERVEHQVDTTHDNIRAHAASLAETHEVSSRTYGASSPVDPLDEHMQLLRDAYDYFVRVSEEQGIVAHAAEWLLDNLYVVEETARLMREDMPSGYYKRLPKLEQTQLKGQPRIYAVAREILRGCDGQVDQDRLNRFVEAYQEVRPLDLGELWALPLMLRLAVIELLAHTISSVLAGREEFEPYDFQPVELMDELDNNIIVGRCIRSLRMLARQDWETFVEELSLVDRVLRRDPAHVYLDMDFDTRDRYRKALEEMAQASDLEELEIAETAVELAQEAPETAPLRLQHVGYYLVGRGRPELEERLEFRPPLAMRLRRWIYEHATGLYVGAIAAITLAVLAGFIGYGVFAQGSIAQLIAVLLFGSVPASIVAVNLVNSLVTRLVPPRVLPKLELSHGLPTEFRSMVVVPCLLTDSEEIQSLLEQIELHYLGNSDPELGFALLSDFRDAPQKHMSGDDALVEEAVQGIQALNRKYAGRSFGPFFIFHRERKWNESEQVWMGWERKRGKLEEFNAYLLGEDRGAFPVQEGNLEFVDSVRYVITLDADTGLPRDAAIRLIGTLGHPLNRAEFDKAGRVVSGYTVLQPRTELRPSGTERSLFSRVFGADLGLDLYTRAVSDVYQDLFGEAIFVGKGIYDVESFYRSLEGRIPENTLLSHDLFEGIHGRAGLITDVVLYEDYPPAYLPYTQRLHRWVRGDWQLVPWLFGRVPVADGGRAPTRLSILDRWKILDNLRRSTRQLTILAFLAAGWLLLPGSPAIWTLFALLTSAMPLVTGTLTALVLTLRDPSAHPLGSSLGDEFYRWLLSIIFLPYEALILFDAAASTLYRVYISQRKLLQWTTAAHTARLFGRERQYMVIWQRMSGASLLAMGIGVLTIAANLRALPPAAPLLVVWVFSPSIAGWISRPRVREEEPLTHEERRHLRRLARRHWRFFEQFIGPEDHWLPPDHFQENPRGLVAHRTSPTNIGLLLLSTLSAYDLGYIGPLELLARLMPTFETLGRLERYRGHLLNWYDTHTLEPLEPRYVSTVDSGNLAGDLIALRQGLYDLRDQELFRWNTWQGLADVLGVLVEIVAEMGHPQVKAAAESVHEHLWEVRRHVYEVREAPERWPLLLTRLRDEFWPQLDQIVLSIVQEDTESVSAARLDALYIWFERVHSQLFSLHRELETLLPWIWDIQNAPPLIGDPSLPQPIADAWTELREALPARASLAQIPELCELGQARLNRLDEAVQEHVAATDGAEAARDWIQNLSARMDNASAVAEQILDQIDMLADLCETDLRDMDFRFLFDAQSQVFHIGYNVTALRLDENHYDLLASEARLASLIAAAKGEVPTKHWLHLDRPLTRTDSRDPVLVSWNGSMFEYLMPELLTKAYQGTLLAQTHEAVVQQQIDYAHSKGVPWGISEAGYYHFDAAMNYQYRGFGVPGLGRKRGLAEDLVIAPYASLLAVSVMPRAVMDNIEHLTQEGMLGRYGFYESMDYTPSHLPVGRKRALVQSYMVHHQGMSIVALTNYLKEKVHVRRFHADPRIQSVELLLQERIPSGAPVEEVGADMETGTQPVESRALADPWPVPVHTPRPQVHYLSNGDYGLLVNNSGGGYSQWNGRRLTRWRSDGALDRWGSWIYVKDLDRDQVWSAANQPMPGPSNSQEAIFSPHKVEFRRQFMGVMTHTEVTVAPREDVEIRRVTLTNGTDEPCRLLLTSYGELVMTDAQTDERHPAFNKLFIQSEYLPDLNAQIFWRRLRADDEQPVHVLHRLILPPEVESSRLHEADRRAFVGRGHTTAMPEGLTRDEDWLTGTSGSTLDPIMALGQVVELAPHETMTLAWVTAAGEHRDDVLAAIRGVADLPAIGRTFDAAREAAETELAQLRLTSPEVARIQEVLSNLVYPGEQLRSEPEVLAANRVGQSHLWPYAISGDYPIVLVDVSEEEHLAIVRQLLQAHEYWRRRNLLIDLVILNNRDVSYAQEVQSLLLRLIAARHSRAWVNRRGGIFLVRSDQMSDEDRTLLRTAARAVFRGDGGNLERQLGDGARWPARLPLFEPSQTRPADVEPLEPVARPQDLLKDNGYGGYSPDGLEYQIYLEPGRWTPAPWINVVANGEFGFMVTEAGSGNTWNVNSGENRLTPWHNDPVSDPPAEALYLRDEETGTVWTPTPLPAGSQTPYLVRHGAGYTVFENNSQGLRQQLRVYTAPDDPVKIIHLRLENAWDHPRRLTATYYAEWVLGTMRSITQPYIVPEYDAESHTLLARNRYNEEFSEYVGFLTADRRPHSLTADRVEFLGRNGSLTYPAGMGRTGLSGTVRPGVDPCAAMQLHLDLAPHETQELVFVLGQGRGRQEAVRLARHYQDHGRCDMAWDQMQRMWNDLLGTVTVKTPAPMMNLALNRWLLYQALSCRIWGRSALYQSSGAYGFRDQLQDVMALLHSRPDIAREHILRAARHQFDAGDVLHWWHPPSGRGVRTRITDDLLWLPFVTAHYVDTTGDTDILDERVPFLTGEPLEEGEEERYGLYEETEERHTLFEHCRRAVERGTTEGGHGLPLMGAGDWNDGMNRVGIHGRGESVWLAWFLYGTQYRFAALADLRGEQEMAQEHRVRAAELLNAIQEHGWDGEWYRRAYYDDGSPLGSQANDECQIDSIAQSWSVLSRTLPGAAPTQPDHRAREAMASVYERLVREDEQLLLLFTPPFDETEHDPGYIKGYPPGIRENGGQYTHAALWAVWAFANLDMGQRAVDLFHMINPVQHAETPEEVEKYFVEPYVVAADVYSVPPFVGHGGWTWYTGSSGWMYRLGIEGILGIRRRGERLSINPHVPDSWDGFRMTYVFRETVYRIEVVLHADEAGITINGEPVAGNDIRLIDDDMEHEVVVRITDE